MAAAENANLARPEAWYAYDSATSQYALTDPNTGDPLNPNVVPSYITGEPKLKAGIDYLGARRDDVTLTIAYGAHQRVADLGDPNKGWFERQVANADYYGIESLNHDPKTISTIREIARISLDVLWRVGGPDASTNLDSFMEMHSALLAEIGEKPPSGFKMRRDRAIGLSSRPFLL